MGASLDGLLLAQEHFAAGCGSAALAVNMHVSPTGQGVTVTAVVPAAIRGPVMDTVPDERLAALEQSIPVGRFGEATEVAEMVAFLCSSHAGFITDAALDISGGLSMR